MFFFAPVNLDLMHGNQLTFIYVCLIVHMYHGFFYECPITDATEVEKNLGLP